MNLASDRDRRHLEVIYNLSRELARYLDLSEVLSRTLELMVESPQRRGRKHRGVGRRRESSSTPPSRSADRSSPGPSSSWRRPCARGWPAGCFPTAKWRWSKTRRTIRAGSPSDPTMASTYTHASQPTRSAVSAPLQGREGVVGVITLVHPEPGHFSSEDLQLLAAIAETVGLAVENARLFTLEHQRRMFASTLQEVARTINSSLEPEKVFPLILDQLSQVVKFDSASLLLHNGDMLRVAASRGFAQPSQTPGFPTSLPDGQSLLAHLPGTQGRDHRRRAEGPGLGGLRRYSGDGKNPRLAGGSAAGARSAGGRAHRRQPPAQRLYPGRRAVGAGVRGPGRARRWPTRACTPKASSRPAPWRSWPRPRA